MSDQKTRVWQYIQKVEGDKPPILVVVQRDKGQINGTSTPAVYRQAVASDCHQYVIRDTEEFYAEACRAMERYATKYGLVELKEEDIGTIPAKLVFRPKEQPEVAALRQENERLKAMLSEKK